MILVTGGTGLIGSHLLLFLTRKGYKPRAIYRNRNSIEKTKNLFKHYIADAATLFNKIEWIEADITDIVSLEAVFEGIFQVYHTAAMVSFNKKDKNILMQTNVEGTANLLHLSLEHGINKFLHVSSIAALGSHDNPVTEQTHWNWKEKHSDYAISKYLSEMAVWRAGQEGLPVVIINPSVVIGAHFWDRGIGKIIESVEKNLNFYPLGGNGFVDVWDIVKVMYQLMESPIINNSFIVSAYNRSYYELLKHLAVLLNRKSPKLKLTKLPVYTIYLLGWLKEFFGIGQLLLSRDMINTLFSYPKYSSEKLKTTLNIDFIPFEASLKNLIHQYRQKGK